MQVADKEEVDVGWGRVV